MRTHGAHACVHKQAHPCLTWIEWKMKQKRPYDFDNLRSETLYWVIQPKGQSCPLKIRSFGLSSFPSLLSFSFFFSQKLSSVLCPLFHFFSLLLSHTFSRPLLLGEAWMQAADGWDVSCLRGIVLVSFPLLSPCQEVSKVGWRVIGNWQGESWHKGCWGQH